MIRFLALFFISLPLLVGCATDGFDPKSNVRLVTTTVYPELPNIEPVEPVNLIPWEADVPRDTSVLSVKNVTTCRNVGVREDPEKPGVILPNEPQSDSWWARCGEHPILPDSNIFIGFDQHNWNIIQENLAKLREAIFRYKKRIEEVNRQREEWRRKSDEERMRVNGDGVVSNIESTESKNKNESSAKETDESNKSWFVKSAEERRKARSKMLEFFNRK